MTRKTTIGHHGVALLALALGASAATPAFADLSFGDFNSLSGLTLVGSAAQTILSHLPPGETNHTLSITPPIGDCAGAVWANATQNVVDGFVTEFDFRIRDKMGIGADGFAFLVQNDARGTSAIGGRGGAIGFGTNPYFSSPGGPGLTNSVAIVFDTWDNSRDWVSLPGTNILTVQLNANPSAPNGPQSTFSIAHVQPGGAFNDGNTHHVKIEYVTGALQVFIDSPTAILTAQLDIGTQLDLPGTNAFVGFTAGCGSPQDEQCQEIRDWTFTESVPAPTSASLLALGGLLAARRRRL